MVSVDSSVQLEKVLKLLPQRRTMGKYKGKKKILNVSIVLTNLAPKTDAIMQAFLTDVNYHYYIIHPTSLLKDYNIWWSLRTTDSPVSLQYTLLLAMVNAGTLQHVGNELQNRLEAEFGESTDSFSDRLHDATRELASVVPVGHYHMLNVQRLLHSCYWYKAEARFVEAWHVLSQAILEARELRKYHYNPHCLSPNLTSFFIHQIYILRCQMARYLITKGKCVDAYGAFSIPGIGMYLSVSLC